MRIVLAQVKSTDTRFIVVTTQPAPARLRGWKAPYRHPVGAELATARVVLIYASHLCSFRLSISQRTPN